MTTKDILPRETYNATLTTTNDTQVCVSTWQNSKNGTLRWKKLTITNAHATNAAQVLFWDQDTGSATPGSYGSNAAPLYVQYVAAKSTIQIGENELPNQQFIAGIAAKTDNTTVYISVEVEKELF